MTQGNCNVYYFDDEKMRVCESKKFGKDSIFSSLSTPYAIGKSSWSIQLNAQ